MIRRWRTTIALAVVAVGLLVFILVDRDSITSDERNERRTKLLPDFVRARVSRIEIHAQGERTVLVRKTPDAPFTMTSPVSAPVDDEAVEGLLGSVEWAEARRTLERVRPVDLRRFGLSRPRVRAEFTVGDLRFALLVGREDPTEGGAYVRLAGRNTAHVVGKDVVEALDNDASHFRTKRLVSAFDVHAAKSIVTRSHGQDVRIERSSERFWLVGEHRHLASRSLVEDQLAALEALKASRYVEEHPKTLAPYGLQSPAVDVSVDVGPRHVRLRAGAVCGSRREERYVVVDEGPVACVLASDLPPFERTAEQMRETRVSSLAAEEVGSFEVALESGTQRLSRDGGTWVIASGAPRTPADEDAVMDFLRALHELRGQPVGEAEAPEGPAVATLLVRGEHGYEERLETRRRADGTLHVQRSGDAGALSLPKEALARVAPSPFAFRRRMLLQDEGGDVRAIRIERPSGREHWIRGGDGWSLEGSHVGGDPQAIADLRTKLTTLSVDSYEAAPANTFSRPIATITWEVWSAATHDRHDTSHGHTYDEPAPPPRRTEHRLVLASRSAGGAYGRLDADPVVFVIDDATLDALVRPVVDRDLMEVPLDEVTAVQLVKANVAWTRGAEPMPDVVRSTLRTLDDLRAVRVEAGPTRDRMRTVAVVRLGKDNTRTVAVGPSRGAGPATLVPIAVDGAPFRWLVPRDALTTPLQ